MRFNQQVLLKHEHGITAQWMADDYSNMAIATYQQEKGTGTDVDGNQVILKKWVMVNCSGPWTGLSEDGKSLVINGMFDAERKNIAGEATVILTCLNATLGGEKVLDGFWNAQKIGF